MYIAAYLRERFDVDIRIIDQRIENCSGDFIVEQAVAHEADVVGLGAFTQAARAMYRVADQIRAARPDATIVLGGPHASAFAGETLRHCAADAAVVGEGERAFEQILEALAAGSDFATIAGLAWRDRSGEIITNPGPPAFLEDLDTLPFPAYDLVPVEKYWKSHGMADVPARPYMGVFTSRGCPYHCIYCHNIFGKAFRSQSPERVADEFAYYRKRWNVGELEILDDTFNSNRARVFGICDALNQRDLHFKICFPNGLRTDALTEPVLDALVGAGLYYSAFALESGSPRVQRYIRKNMNIDRFLEGVEMATRRRVLAHGFAMLGFPTETEDDLRQTIDVMCRSRVHLASFSTVTPYPNTELYDIVAATRPDILGRIDYEDKDHSGIALNLSDVPDDVFFRLQREAWRRFYLNPFRAARILRDYPRPFHLLNYAPTFAKRLVKGAFRTGSCDR